MKYQPPVPPVIKPSDIYTKENAQSLREFCMKYCIEITDFRIPTSSDLFITEYEGKFCDSRLYNTGYESSSPKFIFKLPTPKPVKKGTWE